MTDNLTSFGYNILVANLHEMHTFLSKEIKNGYTKETIKENYYKILITMMPIIPHFAQECMDKNDFKIEQNWPSYDDSLLIEDEIKYVIQINGKKRALIDAKRDISEDNLLEEIKKNNNLSKYLYKKEFNKVIFIKNKLMNIIIK
jgi:leucyl-tRNA synthetase